MKINCLNIVWWIICIMPLCGSYAQQPTTIRGGFITLDSSYVANPQMEAIIAGYRDSIATNMNRVIGVSQELMYGEKPESNLSNFITDVVREHITNLASRIDTIPAPQVAMFNIKGIRSVIPQGDILLKHLFEVLPFENEIVVLGLKGVDVKELMQFMAAEGGDGISGASFVLRDGKAFDVTIGGEPVRDDEVYVFALPDYIANGGDRYVVFGRSTFRVNTGLKIREVVTEHIIQQTTLGHAIKANTLKRIINEK